MNTDTIREHAHAHVDKWDEDKVEWVRRESGVLAPSGDLMMSFVKPDDTSDAEHNLITTVGLTRLVSLLAGAGGLAITNTTARLGTGNGASAAAVGDTDFSATAGAANRWFQIMDATFPTIATSVLTAKSSFATGDGNYAWNEWGIDISAATAASSAVVGTTLFNHKSSAALGTKVSGIWALTVTISFS